jgi:hypothetical protein
MAVSFQSANTRRWWQSAVLVSALHISIAIAVGHFFVRSSYDNPWIIAGFVYAGFLGLSFFWWISRQGVAWLVWRVIWHRAMTGSCLSKGPTAEAEQFLSVGGGIF